MTNELEKRMNRQQQALAGVAIALTRNAVVLDRAMMASAILSVPRVASLVNEYQLKMASFSLATSTLLSLQRATAVALVPPTPRLDQLLEAHREIMRSMAKVTLPLYRN